MPAPCSYCKQLIADGAGYCPSCFLAVRWGPSGAVAWIPEVPIGHPILRLDLRQERPPGMKEEDHTLANGGSCVEPRALASDETCSFRSARCSHHLC